jgi:hypothetical protein|eukprot:scaffold187_cov266-Chaetoceros_neogracile.AAC.14
MGKGKLKFKGDKDAANKKKKKKIKHEKQAVAVKEQSTIATAEHSAPAFDHHVRAAPKIVMPQIPNVSKGIGSISTSGTVVYGHDTKFNSTLNAGDAILVDVQLENGTTQEEMRILTMQLSDKSASLSSAFSHDVKNPTEFKYISKPRDQRKERTAQEKKEKMTQDEIERTAFGTYGGGGKEFVYEERTEHGSYRIKKTKIQGEADRSDLLHMRAQKKSDKYC